MTDDAWREVCDIIVGAKRGQGLTENTSLQRCVCVSHPMSSRGFTYLISSKHIGQKEQRRRRRGVQLEQRSVDQPGRQRMCIRVERRQHEPVAQLLKAGLVQDVGDDGVCARLKRQLLRAVAAWTMMLEGRGVGGMRHLGHCWDKRT